MNKVLSYGLEDGTWNLTSDEPLTLEDIDKAKMTLFGMRVEINPMMPKNTIMIASSKDAVVKIFKLGNRKVLFSLWGFELAYYKKGERQ